MDNLEQFSQMTLEDKWRTQTFRQNVVTKIEEAMQRSGIEVVRNSSEIENYIFNKASTRDEYMNMVAKIILHLREMSQPNMQGPNQNQQGPNAQVQNQPGP